MKQIPSKTLSYPMLNPRIESGASLGYTALDSLSFAVGLMAGRRHI